MNIAVSTESVGDESVLLVKSLEHRIDASVAEDFEQKMLSLVENGPSHLVLDISDVESLDSSGLGAIIATLKQLGPSGEMTVCGAQEPVLNMFKMTRMDRLFNMCASLEDVFELST